MLIRTGFRRPSIITRLLKPLKHRSSFRTVHTKNHQRQLWSFIKTVATCLRDYSTTRIHGAWTETTSRLTMKVILTSEGHPLRPPPPSNAEDRVEKRKTLTKLRRSSHPISSSRIWWVLMAKRIPLLVLTAQAMSALFKKACRCRPESKETSSWEAQTVTSHPIALELTHEVRDLLGVHCQGSYQASTGAGKVLQVDNLSSLEPAASICISLWIKTSHI